MRSYVVNSFGGPLEASDLPDPVPTGTEVVINVTRSGICHTDLHLQDGFYDLGGGKKLNLAERGITPPLTLGHETLGVLEAAGPDAGTAEAQVGRIFLVYPWIGCGACPECESGQEGLCATPAAIGVARPGGYAEKCVVPHPRYLVDVGNLDPALAATYACSGLTAYSALRKVDINQDRDLLLLIGLGGVGLSGLHLAKALGYQNIAVAEVDPAKRQHAASYDGVVVVDPTNPASIEAAGLTGRVRAAVDFVGNGATSQFAVSTLLKGGTLVVVGLFGGELTLPLPTLVQRSLTVRGSFVGSLEELRELVELAATGRLEPLPITEVPFVEVDDALTRLRNGSVAGRLVLTREAVDE